MVSHELLTPLTSTKGFVAIVLNKEAGALTAQQEQFLTIANQSLDRLMLIIDDLLDFSRLEAGKVKIQPVSTDLADLLEQARRDNSATAKKRKISLELQPLPPLPRVLADPHRVRQVVDNLITNAMKFSPEKGRVILSARERGDDVVVSVKDTGMGIPASECERIFERFYQVDKPADQPAPRPTR